MPARLRDIAQDADVSVATASRVLSGTRPVRPELRQRVLTSAAQRGYQPNILARSLRVKKTFVLGVIIPSLINPFFTDIIRAIENVAFSRGYAVTICSSDYDLTKEQRYLEVLRNRMMDGALITAVDATKSDLSPLLQAGIPIVLLDRVVVGVPLDIVTVDTYRGAYTAVEYLIERGYNRIGTVAGPQNISTGVYKLQGYRQALLDHELPIDESLVAIGDYTEGGGVRLARQLLDLPQPPDAVLVANNQMTLGFFTVVRERGIRVPQQIALIGFDDASWAKIAVPPITIIDQPTYDVGHIAVEMLLNRIENGKGDPQRRVLPTKLIVRGSC